MTGSRNQSSENGGGRGAFRSFPGDLYPCTRTVLFTAQCNTSGGCTVVVATPTKNFLSVTNAQKEEGEGRISSPNIRLKFLSSLCFLAAHLPAVLLNKQDKNRTQT